MIFSFHPFQWPNCCIYMMDYCEQLCTGSSLCEVSLTDDSFWYEFCAIHFLNVCLCVCVCFCTHFSLCIAYFSVVSFVKEILILNHKKEGLLQIAIHKKKLLFVQSWLYRRPGVDLKWCMPTLVPLQFYSVQNLHVKSSLRIDLLKTD